MKSFRNIRTCSKSIILTSCYIITSCYSFSQVAEYSKSYINITNGSKGGVTKAGDVLEIRATFAVRSGTFDSCAYYDVIPTGTTYVPNTIKILTNEGKIYKQFSDAINDDAGWISGTSIRVNLGYNPLTTYATATRRGTVAVTDKPAYFTSGCIMIASFRVSVNAAATTISTGGGSISLKNGVNPIYSYTFPANTLRVYSNYGLSTGTAGPNMFTAESNGTFGGGKPRNRSSSAYITSSYTYNIVDVGSPHDNFYAVTNNTSTRSNYTTLNTWANPDLSSPSHRVFSKWDIIGDHTNAVSSSSGNSAADTVANSNAGYMLVVNSAFKTDSVLQVTINGLCANTLYDISCWVRNICPKCGCDSNGKAATDVTGPVFYIPTAPGDSSGVAPNLIFEIDGLDYYSTGNISYTGQWVKKGFSFVTGSSTSFTLRIFNNAPAGSGNDWALDDIVVNNVAPTMIYSPGPATITCESNTATIYDTIRSAAGNYVYYKWQRSTNGGTSWSDVTAPLGAATPYWNGSAWEYVASYTITPLYTTQNDSGTLYRTVVSGRSANLTSASCSFTSGYYTLRIIDCGIPLDLNLLSFSGSLKKNYVILNWETTGEDEPIKYDIEKSMNDGSFTTVYTIDGYNNGVDAINAYSWTDPDLLKGKAYYRLRIYNNSGNIKYSKIVVFSTNKNSFELVTIDNPFGSSLLFSVYSGQNRNLNARLIDGSGRSVKENSYSIVAGTNWLRIENTSDLSTGIYFLFLYSNGETIKRKILKQ
jgi:hypothetical protein